MAERTAPPSRDYSGLWTESHAVCKTRLLRASETKHLLPSLMFETPHQLKIHQLYSKLHADLLFFVYFFFFKREAVERLKHEHLQFRNLESVKLMATQRNMD